MATMGTSRVEAVSCSWTLDVSDLVDCGKEGFFFFFNYVMGWRVVAPFSKEHSYPCTGAPGHQSYWHASLSSSEMQLLSFIDVCRKENTPLPQSSCPNVPFFPHFRGVRQAEMPVMPRSRFL